MRTPEGCSAEPVRGLYNLALFVIGFSLTALVVTAAYFGMDPRVGVFFAMPDIIAGAIGR